MSDETVNATFPEQPMMKCGHAANGVKDNGDPVCVICVGDGTGYDEVDDDAPSLEGRMSICLYCKRTRPSHTGLPFFSYRPDKKYDEHYDGCMGWD